MYSLNELIGEITAGKKFSYLFFWGHRPYADGGVGPSCCSQWYQSSFKIDDVLYPTAEHFMMAEKARLFGDNEMLEKILAAPGPNEAKSLGRKVKGFDQQKWEENCIDIVVRGNTAKFSQNSKLKYWLIGTAPQVLVEASPVDPIWGIGLHREDERAKDPHQWPGKNLLGFALMNVRDRLTENQQ